MLTLLCIVGVGYGTSAEGNLAITINFFNCVHFDTGVSFPHKEMKHTMTFVAVLFVFVVRLKSI